jgi:hypothetical protein
VDALTRHGLDSVSICCIMNIKVSDFVNIVCFFKRRVMHS